MYDRMRAGLGPKFFNRAGPVRVLVIIAKNFQIFTFV